MVDSNTSDSESQIALTWLQENLEPGLEKSSLYDRESLDEELHRYIVENEVKRSLALESLLPLLRAGVLSATTIYRLTETYLLTVPDTDKQNRRAALATLVELPLHKDKEDPIDFEPAGKLALEALERSLSAESRFPGTAGDTSYSVDLLSLIKVLGYRPAMPILAALSLNEKDTRIRAEAASALVALEDMVGHLWQNTPPDLLSNNLDRSLRIKEGFNDPDLNENELVQNIFNALKSASIKDESDPLVEEVLAILKNPSEKLRLAGCLSVAEMSPSCPVASLVNKAIENLAQTGVNGEKPAAAREAGSILSLLEKLYPDKASRIETARIQANLSYLLRFNMGPDS
ncbi:MAG: hypothetical protein H6677_17790 [Candidatus Obscuribacterales bacterium]|nr:hypothetical protein [Candidatus Obscuribacterales bacterium]